MPISRKAGQAPLQIVMDVKVGADVWRNFLSVVLVVRNIRSYGPQRLLELQDLLNGLVADFELIIVDNGSNDGTPKWLKELLDAGALVNTLVFCLSEEVEVDAALWIGVERAIGDIVVTIPAGEDDPRVIQEFLACAADSTDLIIGANQSKPSGSASYRLSKKIIDLFSKEESSLSRCFMLSRRLVNFLQLHNQPHVTFRQLARVPGLKFRVINYQLAPMYPVQHHTFRSRYSSGLRFVFWRNPRLLRLASLFSLAGAAVNGLYASYVLLIFLSSDGIEPGWTSLSLQFSGMFFLLSLTLFVLSENLLLAVHLSAQDPIAFVREDFTSKVMGADESLNLRTEIRDDGRVGDFPE